MLLFSAGVVLPRTVLGVPDHMYPVAPIIIIIIIISSGGLQLSPQQ